MSHENFKYLKEIKVYNEEKNLGIISYIDENKVQISCKYFKVQDGEEVIVEGGGQILVFLPEDLDHSKTAIIVDPCNNKVVGNAVGIKQILVDKEKALTIRGSGAQKKVENLSDEEQLLLFDCLSQKKEGLKTIEGIFTIPVSEEDLEKLFPTNAPLTLYDSVNPDIEFGIARFLADQVNHLSSLLSVAEIKHYGEFGYGVYASKQINDDNRLDFEYRFTATGEIEAVSIAKHVKKQLNGLMRKIWLAAWSIGDGKKNHKFMVPLLDLMRECHPERESNFSEKEIEDFYQTLKAMKPAQFTLVKKFKKKGEIKSARRS